MIIKIDRAAFEEAVAAFTCAARNCRGGHEWTPVEAPAELHDRVMAAVRGAMSSLFSAPVFVDDEHASGLPVARDQEAG